MTTKKEMGDLNEHQVVLVLKGSSKDGAISYPNMLLLVKNAQNQYDLPTFVVLDKDPLRTVIRSVRREMGSELSRAKEFLWQQFGNTYAGFYYNVFLTYYEVYTAGFVGKVPFPYNPRVFSFRNIDTLNSLTPKSTALEFYETWLIDKGETKKEDVNSSIIRLSSNISTPCNEKHVDLVMKALNGTKRWASNQEGYDPMLGYNDPYHMEGL